MHELVHAHFIARRLPVLLAADRPRPAAGALAVPGAGAADVPVHAVPHRARADHHAEQRRCSAATGTRRWAWPGPTRAHDQIVAGGILWAGGEFVAVTMLAVLVVQWMRQSEREARRIDRQLDREEAGSGRGAGAVRAGTGIGHRRVTVRSPRHPPHEEQRAHDHSTRSCSTATTRRSATGCGWPSAAVPRPTCRSSSSTPPPTREVVRLVDDTDVDLLVLDGEATPGRRPRHRPPAQGRDRRLPADLRGDRPRRRPLAGRLRRGSTPPLMHPLDPVTTGQTVAALLRDRAAGCRSLR